MISLNTWIFSYSNFFIQLHTILFKLAVSFSFLFKFFPGREWSANWIASDDNIVERWDCWLWHYHLDFTDTSVISFNLINLFPVSKLFCLLFVPYCDMINLTIWLPSEQVCSRHFRNKCTRMKLYAFPMI